MLLAALMLAGCADDTPTSTAGDPVGNDPGGNETLGGNESIPGNVTAPSHVETTVIDETYTIAANTCNPAGQTEDLLFQIMLPNDTKDFEPASSASRNPRGCSRPTSACTNPETETWAIPMSNRHGMATA